MPDVIPVLISWRCEPCGVEERFAELPFLEGRRERHDCWVCDGPMQRGGHPSYPMTSQHGMWVGRVA